MAFNKEKVMDAARKFVEKNQLDKAVKEYLRVVQEDPSDVRIWLKIGDLYAKKGAKQEAIETYLRIARTYHDQGFFDKAAAVYKQVIKIDPHLVDAHLKLGELFRQLGKLAEATHHFESVAGHFHREGKTKEALATVRQLVELDPDNVATRIKLAELYSKEQMVDDAIREFAAASDQLRRLGREEDFIKVAERLYWHKPDNMALARELSSLYLRRNDPRRALQKLQACFKQDPRDPDTLALLAQAFQGLDQKGKAVQVLKELARIYDTGKAKDKAAEVYRKILQFSPGDADATAFLGKGKSVPIPVGRGTGAQSPLAVAVSASPPSAAAAPVKSATAQNPVVRNATGRVPVVYPAGPQASGQPPVPSRQQHANPQVRMTGAVPLVDAGTLASLGLAPARPPTSSDPIADLEAEFDDGDFSSAFSDKEPSYRHSSPEGERFAEEIAKVLAETDVYIKYGLYPKANEHLKRVFALDPENVDARERLKDVLIAQGRHLEALAELVRLAESTAAYDHERATGFLREALSIDGTYRPAIDLGRRLRLDLTQQTRANDLDRRSAPTGESNRLREQRLDSVDGFDPADIVPGARRGGMAQGSPAPGIALGRAVSSGESFDDFVADGPSRTAESVAPLRMPSQMGAEPDFEFEESALDARGRPASQFEDEPFNHKEARAFDEQARRARSENDVPAQANAWNSDATDLVPLPPDDLGGEAALIESSAPSFEDELDEVDFYLSQQMEAEAVEILRGLLDRYPNHPLIRAKLADAQVQVDPPAIMDVETGAIEAEEEAASPSTEPLSLDEIEEVAEEDLEPVDDDLDSLAAESIPPASRGSAGASGARANPSVKLENPIDEGDADTHYDLGLAYKEMALHGPAIKEFTAVIASGRRQVQSRLMIGLCQREQGNCTEAVNQFKQALHEPAITEREQQSLYYELGVTYETLRDFGEALYYLEMVIKRDPTFLDSNERVARLRGGGARPSAGRSASMR